MPPHSLASRRSPGIDDVPSEPAETFISDEHIEQPFDEPQYWFQLPGALDKFRVPASAQERYELALEKRYGAPLVWPRAPDPPIPPLPEDPALYGGFSRAERELARILGLGLRTTRTVAKMYKIKLAPDEKRCRGGKGQRPASACCQRCGKIGSIKQDDGRPIWRP
eukprot:tig00000870_g5159.t1